MGKKKHKNKRKQLQRGQGSQPFGAPNGKRLLRLLSLSAAGAAAGTIALFALPLIGIEGSMDRQILSHTAAGAFWLSLLFQGYVTARGSAVRKKLERQEKQRAGETLNRIGLFSFFTSREATVADGAFLISACTVMGLILCKVNQRWAVALSVALLFLSFNLHCILNGKNYRWAKRYFMGKKGRK